MDTPERPDTVPSPPPTERPPLRRPAEGRMLGGVCAAIGRTAGVDVLLVRVVAVVLGLAGGAGALLYLGGLILIPEEGADGTAAPERGRTATIAGAVALAVAAILLVNGIGVWFIGPLVPLAALALLGLGAWWVVTGEGASGTPGDILRRSLLGGLVLLACAVLALGAFYAGTTTGGTVVAVSVVLAGVIVLVGAFVRPVRWLILPALALALPLAAAQASEIDLTGGVGERTYRPSGVQELRSGYDLGLGRMVVDLRGAQLPDGDTPVRLRLGAGEAVLLVSPDVCVASRATVRAGAVRVFDGESGGLDVDWQDLPVRRSDGPRVVLDGHVDLGALTVAYADPGDFDEEDWSSGSASPGRQAACEGRRG